MTKMFKAIGLMSGTSLDGVDCALVETDGQGMVRPLSFTTMPYTQKVRDEIRACFGIRNRRDPKVLTAEKLITYKHIEVIEALLHDSGVQREEIDVIGFHGQTIFHAPAEHITVQIGDGALMARECRIDVVDDFRIDDVKAGGEGAPLAPIYHAARLADAKLSLPVVVLNIGGVANVTWIGPGEGNILAFDTGPGNALMDDWIKSRTGEPFDEDGRYAARGTPVEEMLRLWAMHPYFSRRPPKSLDRDQWDIAALGQLAQSMGDISTENGAATLLRFTGDMIVRSIEHMPDAPKAWYACGGGRHNKALMAYLNGKLDGAVKTVDDLGWNGDATEAECFAYLAVRRLLDLPISFPGTTAVQQPMTGGKIHKVA